MKKGVGDVWGERPNTASAVAAFPASAKKKLSQRRLRTAPGTSQSNLRSFPFAFSSGFSHSYDDGAEDYVPVEYYGQPPRGLVADSSSSSSISVASSPKPFYTWDHSMVLPRKFVEREERYIRSRQSHYRSHNAPVSASVRQLRVLPRLKASNSQKLYPHLNSKQNDASSLEHGIIGHARPCSTLDNATTSLGNPSHWPEWSVQQSEDPHPEWKPLFSPFAQLKPTSISFKRFESTKGLVARALDSVEAGEHVLNEPLRSPGTASRVSFAHYPAKARSSKTLSNKAWMHANAGPPPQRQRGIVASRQRPEVAGPSRYYCTSRLPRYHQNFNPDIILER